MLTRGDILYLAQPVPDQAIEGTLLVTSSKRSDCAGNTQVKVSIADLQEMQNDFAANVDGGFDVIAGQQGTQGIPPAPGAVPQPSDAPLSKGSDAAALDAVITQQRQDAVQTESQVQQEALANSPS
ncbi:hypothetical protein [Tunturiibacter lichenicola]|uniref:hypothetical protein n=1 Tax=Tunturiibacter lichenicola TaxID=2051959 RepID=UPI003D9B6BE4